jgi:protein-S-isoprenylcysteine O-methyltransferase Ste14
VLTPTTNKLWELDWARNAALTLYFIAILIFIFAAQALQPSLRINPIPRPGAPLITCGIYKYLRHPMYFAVMLVGTGLLIQKADLISILVWIALAINMSIKARYEDKLLREKHIEAAAYQSKTPDILGERFE